MADAQEIRSVLVTNISPSATEKTVSDFFSFCGKINKLFLKKEEGKDTGSAVIQFETESAAKTALLLTNALIVDRPITVTTYISGAPSSTPAPETTPSPVETGTPANTENIEHKDFGGVSDEDRSKTSVIASLMAAGYVLAENALDKAKEYDEKTNFSQRAKITVDQMKAKAEELDQQLKITERATAVKNAITDTAKKVDAELGLTEKAAMAANAIKVGAQAGMQKIQENQTVKQGLESVKATAEKVSNSVNQTFNEVKAQTNVEIERREGAETQNAPAPAPVTMDQQQ